MENKKMTAAEVKYLSKVAIDLFDKLDKEVEEIADRRTPFNEIATLKEQHFNYVADLFNHLVKTAYPKQDFTVVKTTIHLDDFNNSFIKHMDRACRAGAKK